VGARDGTVSTMMTDAALAQKLAAVLPHLNERQRRLVLAAEARALGHGGIARVARVAGVSRPTIHKALHELEGPDPPPARVRRSGGGRKPAQQVDATLLADLEALVDPVTRGDPMSPLRWTCKSTRQLAEALTERGHRVSRRVVAELLRAADYRLQAPAKTLEGARHPDRDAQFRYLNEQTKAALALGLPVISVDTKKKELVGTFKNGGREWQPTGQPERVNVHDFPDPDVGKAIPYGIYDVGRNAGWVTVGRDHDTAGFAVASLRRWWQSVGQVAYPRADRLLICADGGGSNGYRLRLWKVELQRFATEADLAVTVCHLPPGTSKWNKIEHRLFAHISLNWRGRPLVSHEVVVQLIGATTTRTGLQVQAELDAGAYPTKIKVSDDELAAVRLTPHAFHGEWNYTITPDLADPYA
jgi:DNA-binding phage protein